MAAYELLIYTLLGSLLLIIAIILLYMEIGTTNYMLILIIPMSITRQSIIWLAFMISFAIKIPMIPVHIWLPEAHVEAPTVVSII